MEILIADDHTIVRMGLSLIAKKEFPDAVISEANNAFEVLKQIRSKKKDIVLLDLKMPDTDSLKLIEQLIEEDQEVKILIISLNPESIYALRCLQLGALGYIEKAMDENTIRKAIKTVAQGKKYMSETVMDMIVHSLKSERNGNPFTILSKKEMTVTTHLINGLTNSDVCNLMGIQSSTVATYKSRVFEKLHVNSTHELTQLAQQYGLL